MNLDRLREAEASFLQLYPRGFADPAIQPLRRKHNVDRLVAYARERLTPVGLARPGHVVETLHAVVSRSSMVSRFEKPPFRDFVRALDSDARIALARAVEARLLGPRRRGFEQMLEIFARHGVAKWTTLSALPFYHAPRREAFVKPSTAKRIVAFLEVEDLHYQATPSWAFYDGYRKLLAAVRREVRPSLAPSNAALSGFLMMTAGRDTPGREPPAGG